MWRTIASQVGHERKGWNIAPTQAYKRMTFLLTNAQRESLVLAVTGDAGCGKTEAIKNYAAAGRHVYHLCCSEYWNRRTFMGKLLRCMGIDFTGCTVSDMMDDIIDTLKRTDSPLVVLDEADQAERPSVLLLHQPLQPIGGALRASCFAPPTSWRSA